MRIVYNNKTRFQTEINMSTKEVLLYAMLESNKSVYKIPV